jgi:hypothetical protein
MNYGDKPLTIPPEEGGTPHTPRSIRAITEVGLPALQGTEADIAAASEIRLDKLSAADEVLTLLRTNQQETELGAQSANPPSIPVAESQVQVAQMALNTLRHQDAADWWLAHQDQTARQLLEMFTDNQALPLPVDLK